ncbi:MAG: hypothetical protein WDN45_01345 [Caulobacteraceae bacterium]
MIAFSTFTVRGPAAAPRPTAAHKRLMILSAIDHFRRGLRPHLAERHQDRAAGPVRLVDPVLLGHRPDAGRHDRLGPVATQTRASGRSWPAPPC